MLHFQHFGLVAAHDPSHQVTEAIAERFLGWQCQDLGNGPTKLMKNWLFSITSSPFGHFFQRAQLPILMAPMAPAAFTRAMPEMFVNCSPASGNLDETSAAWLGEVTSMACRWSQGNER